MSANKVLAIIFALTGAVAGVALLTYTKQVYAGGFSFGYTGGSSTYIHVHPHWAIIGGVASLIAGVVLAGLTLAIGANRARSTSHPEAPTPQPD